MAKNQKVRCKDRVWGTQGNTEDPAWCPHSRKIRTFDDPQALDYEDLRCCGWLYICKKTQKVVVHNKFCDVPEVYENLAENRLLSEKL